MLSAMVAKAILGQLVVRGRAMLLASAAAFLVCILVAEWLRAPEVFCYLGGQSLAQLLLGAIIEQLAINRFISTSGHTRYSSSHGRTRCMSGRGNCDPEGLRRDCL
jgi:hypothetical protein